MFRRRLALVAAGILAGFAALEVAFRAYEATRSGDFEPASVTTQARWISHPFLPYAGRPTSKFVALNWPDPSPEVIVTNSYGFRSHEFPTEKQADDFFVLALGGSTTYGYKVASNDETWPEILERKLAARYSERRISVFNLGVDMGNNAVALVNLALVGVHLKPDLIIVYEGYNDLASLGHRGYRTDQAHFYKDLDTGVPGFQAVVPRWALRSYVVFLLTDALDALYGLNDFGQVAKRPDDPDEDRFRGVDAMLLNLETIDAIAKGYGAETLFSTFQFTHESTNATYRRLNDELRGFFAAQELRWVDQAALLPDADPTINVDDCHFTPKGNAMVAQNFFDAIVAHGLVR